MIKPKFLSDFGTIGIVAPSDGFLKGKFKEASLKGTKRLEDRGYKIKYAPSCFNSINGRSNDAKTRAKEFLEMYFDPNINILIAISGGEYEMEILEYLPLRKMKNHPKLFCGCSDNSILSFIMLTNLEIISVYGHNLYELSHKHSVIDNYLETIRGNFLPQKEITKVSKKDYDYNNKTIKENYKIDFINKWKVFNAKNVDVKGIVIGGLIDNLNCICGTKYDKVKKFLTKYKEEGFIWFFDICLLSPEEVKRSLFQFKNSGWFENAKAIMIGRPIIQNDSYGISYQDNMLNELKDLNIPIILDTNIGHIPPSYHFINGQKARVTYTSGKGKIEYLKENE